MFMRKKFKNKIYPLLRATEKYTKTDMIYLASGGFWLSLKIFILGILSLGSSIAFANLLPKETFGQYKYIFSIFGLLALATLPGMGISVVKSVARGYEGTPLFALKTKIKWGVAGSFASVCIALYYFLQGNTTLAGAFVLAALFLPFVDTLNIFNTILTGKQLFRISVFYETMVQMISISTIVTILFFTDNLLAILAGYFLSYTATRFVILRIVVKKHTLNKEVDASAITHGKHLSVMDVLGTATEALENALVWQFMGAAPLAAYALAKTIPLQISAAFKKIATLALPRFARRDIESIKQSLLYRIALLLILLVIVVVAYIIIAPHIFQLIFPKYTDAIIYTQLYILTLLLFPKKIIGTALNAHGQTKALYINSIATPSLKLALLLLMVPSFGIMGAIFAEISAQIFSFALLSFLFIRSRFSKNIVG